MADSKNSPAPAPKDLWDRLQEGALEDMTDAGWRLAGKQFTKLAQEPLTAFFERLAGNDDNLKAKIAAFLKTDIGQALLQVLLSLGLSLIPPNIAGEIGKRIAKELRVSAMTNVGDVVADLLMGPLRQVAVLYIGGGFKQADASKGLGQEKKSNAQASTVPTAVPAPASVAVR